MEKCLLLSRDAMHAEGGLNWWKDFLVLYGERKLNTVSREKLSAHCSLNDHRALGMEI